MARPDCQEVLLNIPLGIIPAGSGNGLAASLGVPNPLSSTFSIISGATHPVDVFSVLQDTRRFYGMLSITWATMSVIDLESEKYRWLGPLRFDLKGIAEVASCNSYKGRIMYIKSEDSIGIQKPVYNSQDGKPGLQFLPDFHNHQWEILDGEWCFFFCAALTPKVIISPGTFANKAVLNDGYIDLILCPATGRIELTQLLTGIENGSTANLPFVKYIKTRAFKLEPDNYFRSAPISVDGEHYNNKPIQVEVHQSLARVYYDFNGKRMGLWPVAK